ncbi:esterase FE4-like [Bacillus rossius redtenbacheri]|uniref:esterase FE4-like n=1 Tax=Bacillus rossius redtenbacheri TaxID=93214 RepID=UPI002FDEDD11
MFRFGVAVFVHLLAFAFLQEQPRDTATVKIAQGTLKGKIEISTVTGQKQYSFLGVPFAKPPLGSLRFKGPRAPESWNGVRDATKEGPMCLQNGAGAEDCLYLNVITPELPGDPSNATLRPVLVWVHGGAYQTGTSSLSYSRPDYFLQRGLVFVSISYRLGVLGFLSLEGTDAPGNAGLKDQVAALRWVKANIARFGGDPDVVTLFGESAGGSSVHHHMLSPLSDGLFQRAISDSGAAMNPTAFFNSTRQRALRLGKILGLETADGQRLVDFLRNCTAELLVASQDETLSQEELKRTMTKAFIPTIEYPVKGEEIFLAASPWEMTKKGQFKRIPYITGTNKDEGILAYLVCHDPTCLAEVDKDFERVLPLNMGLKRGSEQSKKIAAQLRQFYFQNRNVSTETAHNYIDLQTDAMYAYGCHYVVNHSVAHRVANVFNYQFVYDGKNAAGRHPTVQGVAHGDELFYLFYRPEHSSLQANSTDLAVINTMVTMYANFAKTGNPSIDNEVTWKYSTPEHRYYLSINDTPSLEEDFSKERMALWDGIYTYLGFEST